MKLYRLSGELLRSELALDDYASGRGGQEPQIPCISLRLEPPAAQEELSEHIVNQHDGVAGKPFLTVTRSTDAYRIRLHGFADFFVDTTGSEVRCTPLAGCPEEVLAQLFVDRVLPNVMSRRRVPTFHASVVAIGGRAAAFMADPGLGKSTLATALCPPAEHLCDDSAALRFRGAEIVVYPSYPFARLFGDSMEALGHPKQRRAAQQSDKWRVALPSPDAPQALRRVFALAPPSEELRIEPLTPRDAMAELARHLYRLDPSDRGMLMSELDDLERLAELVPVMRLHFPRRFDGLSKVCDRIVTELDA